MCGIVAIIRKDSKLSLNKEHTDIFKQMLYADALRGWDSTGIAAIRMNNDTHVLKDACPPASLFGRHQEGTWIYNNMALVGHNRASTRGRTSAENAHPFTEKHITLVHNGTLRYHHHIKNVEVDSHAITHSMVERGAKNTLEMLDGAYALVWFDTEKNRLYAARNNERPLYLSETDDTYVLSSEYLLAEWICSRNNKKIKKVQLLTSGLIYCFETNKKDMRYIKTERFEPFVFKQPVSPAGFSEPIKEKDFPNNKASNVTQIQPYKPQEEEFYDLKIGQHIEVLAIRQQGLNYSAFGLGKHRWIGESPLYPGLAIEFYTDHPNNYQGFVVDIVINRMYYSPGLKQNYLIGENPVIPQKKRSDETGPIRTSNGVELTDQVLKLCETKYCEECTADFEAGPGITLTPIVVNGHTYNYRYTCTDCTEWLAIKGKVAR